MEWGKSANSTLPSDDYKEFKYGEKDREILSSFEEDRTKKRKGTKIPKSSLGGRIKCARESLGYTQKILAVKCQVTENTIKNIELGRSLSIDPRTLESLSKVLGLSFEAIILGVSAETIKKGVDFDLGLEQRAIDWFHENKKRRPELIHVINRLFWEADTATALLEAINYYWDSDLLPMMKDSMGLIQEVASQAKAQKHESMATIEAAIKRYSYSKPQYHNEEKLAEAERRVKRTLERVVESRLELEAKTERENQMLVTEQEIITPDEI